MHRFCLVNYQIIWNFLPQENFFSSNGAYILKKMVINAMKNPFFGENAWHPICINAWLSRAQGGDL